MKYQAFISCDPADRDLAADVRAALTAAGLSCTSYEDLRGGEDYHKALADAIGQSKTLVFIPPAGFGADSTIHSEVETAVKLKRTVIPYYRRRVELDDSLRFLTQTSSPIWADEGEASLQKAVDAVRSAKEPPKPHRKAALVAAAIAAVVLIVAGALLFTLLRNPEPTAVGQDGDNTWSFYEGSGKLVITGEGSGLDYDYFAGVSEGEKAPWWDYKDSVKKVIVEEGVTGLGWGVFNEMTNLETVTLPSTIQNISTQLVYDCPKIREITIPEGVTLINYGAFVMCDSLEKISIPSTVTMISGAPCQQCENLKEIEVSENNPKYQTVDGVLYSKDMVELIQYPTGFTASSYTMPDTVETIAPCSLMGCVNLKTIEFSDSLRKIDVYALYNVGIAEAQLPDTLTELESGAFCGCDYLASVTLQEGLTSIGSFAFFACPELKEITIPASVAEIGAAAFGYSENEQGEFIFLDTLIKGKAGSAAEDYAEQYHCTFEAI